MAEKRKNAALHLVGTLYRSGFLAGEIARRCGLSEQAIALEIEEAAAADSGRMLAEPVPSLLAKLDALELLYRRAVEPDIYCLDSEASGDNDPSDAHKRAPSLELKALQGIERCIELRMRLLGFDGKSVPAQPAPQEPPAELDLTRLSENALKELVGAIGPAQR